MPGRLIANGWAGAHPDCFALPRVEYPAWYDSGMTTVEILYSYTTQPTEKAVFALANAKDVYGIRKLSFDRAAKTLRVEYDATRLTTAAVTKLVRDAGLEIAAELPLIPDVAPEPVAAN